MKKQIFAFLFQLELCSEIENVFSMTACEKRGYEFFSAFSEFFDFWSCFLSKRFSGSKALQLLISWKWAPIWIFFRTFFVTYNSNYITMLFFESPIVVIGVIKAEREPKIWLPGTSASRKFSSFSSRPFAEYVQTKQVKRPLSSFWCSLSIIQVFEVFDNFFWSLDFSENLTSIWNKISYNFVN